MNPQFLDDMSWEMAQVYGSVTDRILINIARHFPYIKRGAEPKELFEYQVKKLAEMGQLNSETVDIIAKSLDGADAALRDALEAAIRDALKDVEPTLRKASEQGLLMGPGMVPPEVSPGQMTAFRMYYAQSADKMNLVNTVMLESTQAAYTQTLADVVNTVQRTQGILNAAAGETITGVSAWNEAMHNAVQKMVQNGLTGFIDHAGRRWSPEAYVAMDIRTTLHNTANAAVWERSEEYGSDIYQVSTHAGARPLCYPWQGKLISRTDNSREVPDLNGTMVHVYAQKETSYGQPAGLFGINCGHYPTPFIPGFSALRGMPQDKAENDRVYAESQEQRALERKLRKEKLDYEVLKAQGADEETLRAQRARVKKASDDIEAFCEETGRTRRKAREYTPVNATFPPKGSYDPAEFPTETRDRIDDWFNSEKNNSVGNDSSISFDGGDEFIDRERHRNTEVQQRMRELNDESARLRREQRSIRNELNDLENDRSANANAKREQLNQRLSEITRRREEGIPAEYAQLSHAQTVFNSANLVDEATAKGIEYNVPARNSGVLSETEIINRIGGGDMTEGSCASVAMCYVGQKEGYDVLDFRGGESRVMISFDTRLIIKGIAEETGYPAISGMGGPGTVPAIELVKKCEPGKEYLFSAGHHATVVRVNSNGAFEYLELQSGLSNGWKSAPIGVDGRQDLDTLFGWRFGCNSSENDVPIMIDVKGMQGSRLFHRALGYINTKAQDQIKGDAGYEK